MQTAVASSPLSPMRENSSGREGPSACQSPLTGNAPGFHNSEPQPKHAIFIFLYPAL